MSVTDVNTSFIIHVLSVLIYSPIFGIVQKHSILGKFINLLVILLCTL